MDDDDDDDDGFLRREREREGPRKASGELKENQIKRWAPPSPIEYEWEQGKMLLLPNKEKNGEKKGSFKWFS